MCQIVEEEFFKSNALKNKECVIKEKKIKVRFINNLHNCNLIIVTVCNLVISYWYIIKLSIAIL